MTEPGQGTPNTSILGNAMYTPRPGSVRSNTQNGKPSLAVILLREIMKELCKTRKVAEKALEKA
ncbi:unnamed protein product [Prunus armeniaca]|uniref:Uncharacterized protein n=1 Tax=Prunus armeniaca TaxID=36596 RepID=A0A6J5X3C0_PRUAR|nr:unnamed protein product [Prunus armeniaca]